MPSLTFPIIADGMVVPVLVGLNDVALAKLIVSGLPVPPPISCIGVIDTGCNVTCVSSNLLKQIGLAPVQSSTSTTAAGQIAVDLYEISLSIAPVDGGPSPLYTHPDLLVMEWKHPDPPIEVLVGRDVLKRCKTLIDGPGDQFILDF